MSFIKNIFNNLFRRHSIPILCALVVFMITLLAYQQLKDYVQYRHEKIFALQAEHATDVIKNKVSEYEKILMGAKAFYEASDTISRERWRLYVRERRNDKDLKGYLNLGFISYLTGNQMQSHINQMQHDDKNYHVFPKGDRELYAVIDFLEPASLLNNTSLGFDMFSDPVRKEAISRARGTGKLSASGKVKFTTIDSKSGNDGFLLFMPVYKNNVEGDSSYWVRNAPKGFIYCPYPIGLLMQIVKSRDFKEMALEIYDGEFLNRDALILDSDQHNDLLDKSTTSMHKLLPFEIGGRRWNLYYTALPGFGASADSNLPIIVLFGGLIIGILLFFVIYAYSSRQLESLILARKMTKSLRESEAQITNIFNNSPDAVIVIDKDSKILKWNPKAEKLFGWKEEEVTGTSLTNAIVPQQHREAHTKGMARFLATGNGPVINTTMEITALNKDQQEFDIELSISNTTENGSPIFIAFINDITERKKSQNIIFQKTKELESSNAELQQFASIASHDLKEPLRKILLFGDLLAKEYKEQVAEEGQAYIERMQNAASRMQELIEDLLAFSRIGSKQEYFESVDLNVVLQGILSDLEISIQQKQAKIIFDKLPTLNAIPNQMRQLFQNLISNALKFCQKDTLPLIKISYKIIKGSQLKEGTQQTNNQNYYEIKVSDNGIGFDAIYAEKIFVIFQRLHGRDAYDGTGIGLAICKKIAEYHKGFITAESKPGEGSTFTITLPVLA
jgi:two-component system sensor kinase FixL